MVTDAQVSKLMKELDKHGKLGLAAIRAGMDRKTARRWRDAERLPSETRKPRTWRTRKDPFEEDWPTLEGILEAAPELDATTLFEWLNEQHVGRYKPGQLRTLQRRVRKWKAEHGPPREVFFPQAHRPGEAAQTDFTRAKSLVVTIGGEPFDHLIGLVVLPYSNWRWPTVCRSESMAALSETVQDALFELGAIPEWHQTDNSTAATHDLSTGKRAFNDNYAALMSHLGMKPRTTGVGEKEQNGDVESANGAFKRKVRQYLLLRGSCDFDTVHDYQTFLRQVATRANRLVEARLAHELAVMTTLNVDRRPSFRVIDVTVTSWSTIRVMRNTYSVPSRLIGQRLRVRVHDDRIEAYLGATLQLATSRLHGAHGHRIDYRHVIWSLVRKPGAFARYRYRNDLFPTAVFRRAHDALAGAEPTRRSDLAYLRVLHLAASTSQNDVEVALELLLEAGKQPTADAVREVVGGHEEPSVPNLAVPEPNLGEFDALLGGGVQ